MVRPFLVSLLFCCASLTPKNVLGDSTFSMEQLRSFDVRKLDQDEQKTRVQRTFPVAHEKVQEWLSNAITQRMLTDSVNGLAVVLYSHGGQGFIWGLREAGRDSGPARLTNLCKAFKYFRYREACVFYVSLLDDKRPVPEIPLEYRQNTRHGDIGLGSGFGPERICDVAATCFGTNLGTDKSFPKKLQFKGSPHFPSNVPVDVRDQDIAMLKEWWAKEGERYITATRPSVVEVLLKEAEERSKQAELGAQGAKADEKPKGEVGDGAPPAGPKTIEGKESEPKAREPVVPEGEKKEPEKK